LAGLALPVAAADAPSEVEQLRKQFEAMRQDYAQRLQDMEKRLQAAEQAAAQAEIKDAKTVAKPAETQPATAEAAPAPAGAVSNTAFNPAISLILEGRYAAFQRDPAEYRLLGFPLQGEALGEEGFSLGHSELILSANVDDLFYGQLTTALHAHEGETEIELEEAFIQSLSLGHGLTAKAGRFFSGLGYINSQHPHAWDFADAPLIYRGLFGDQYNDDGLQLTWLAPTDFYVLMGGEALRGGHYPAQESSGVGAYTLFAKTGGDVGDSHSWQAGLSYLAANGMEGRDFGTSHDHEEGEAINFSGDSRTVGLDFIWKWAPHGNPKTTNAKLQFEYFERREDGELAWWLDYPPLTTQYDGKQRGFYVQGVYQFMPQWRVGARYDWLKASNSGVSDRMEGEDWISGEILEHASLASEGHSPQRYSLMLDWSNSEYSRIRLQFNRDESMPESDNQFYIQYLMSLGAHGAHPF
jgi:hypothetical protein